MSKNKKVYISGPITGTKDFRERFKKAEKALADQGYIPVNPVDLHDQSVGRTWIEFLEEDIRALKVCEYIYFLPGWICSRGSRWEYREARKIRIRVLKMGVSIPLWSTAVKLLTPLDERYITRVRKNRGRNGK